MILKVYRVEFTNEFDPEFDMFEDVIVAHSLDDVFSSYSELFEDENKSERYKRKLSVTELDRVLGIDGSYYNIVAVKL